MKLAWAAYFGKACRAGRAPNSRQDVGKSVNTPQTFATGPSCTDDAYCLPFCALPWPLCSAHFCTPAVRRTITIPMPIESPGHPNEWKKKDCAGSAASARRESRLVAAEPHVATSCRSRSTRRAAALSPRPSACMPASRIPQPHGLLDDDIACRTVGDRVAMYKKYLKANSLPMRRTPTASASSRTARDPVAPTRRAYSPTALRTPRAGIGSGVLAKGAAFWYTCIPDLRLLKDTKGAGRADIKKSLHTGYGFHVSSIGHDSHGLRMGPRRQAVFSIGDRGLHIEKDGKVLASAPDTGAVLRCNPMVPSWRSSATGLRNPQDAGLRRIRQSLHRDNNADAATRPAGSRSSREATAWRIGTNICPTRRLELGKGLPHAGDQHAATFVPPLATSPTVRPSDLPPGTTSCRRSTRNISSCAISALGRRSGVHSFRSQAEGRDLRAVDRQQFVWTCWPPIATSAPTADSTSATGSMAGASPARAASSRSSIRNGSGSGRRRDEKAARGGLQKKRRMTNW